MPPQSVEASRKWLPPSERANRIAFWASAIGLPVVVSVLALSSSSAQINQWLLGLYALSSYVLLLRLLRVDWLTTIVLVAALLYCALYTSYTSILERTPDALAQLRYLAYIKKNVALPPPSECLVCNHPPLYYLLLAAWSTLNGWLDVLPGERVLQAFSLLLAAAYLVFAPLTLRRFTNNPALVRLGAALVCFWPTTIMQSCRVHNDSLAKLLMAAGLYWLIRWYQDDRSRDLALAGAFAALSVLTKSSGYVLVFACIVLVAWRALAAGLRRRFSARRLWPLLLLALGVATAQLTSRAPEAATPCEHLFGQACKHRGPNIPNELATYTYLDLKGFVGSPYLVVGKQNLEYHYFLNCLIKSSLFGMHTARPDLELALGDNPKIAAVLNYVLLLMLAYGLVFFAARPRLNASRHAPALAAVALAVALLIAFRVMTPIPYHSDFRHVQALLVVFVAFFVNAVEWHWPSRRLLAGAGVALALVVIAGSVLHFIPKPRSETGSPRRAAQAESSR